jgi:hypothetical protein
MSDGITDNFYPGHVSDEQIHEVLASDHPPLKKAQEILDQAAVFDDASIIVVEATRR